MHFQELICVSEQGGMWDQPHSELNLSWGHVHERPSFLNHSAGFVSPDLVIFYFLHVSSFLGSPAHAGAPFSSSSLPSLAPRWSEMRAVPSLHFFVENLFGHIPKIALWRVRSCWGMSLWLSRVLCGRMLCKRALLSAEPGDWPAAGLAPLGQDSPFSAVLL